MEFLDEEFICGSCISFAKCASLLNRKEFPIPVQ